MSMVEVKTAELIGHTHGTLVAIGWDGTSTYQCSKCGKRLEFPLKQPTKSSGDGE